MSFELITIDPSFDQMDWEDVVFADNTETGYGISTDFLVLDTKSTNESDSCDPTATDYFGLSCAPNVVGSYPLGDFYGDSGQIEFFLIKVSN